MIKLTKIQSQLLELLKKESTLDALQSKLKLSRKQTYNRIQTIENKGFNVERKDFANGITQFGVSQNLTKDLNTKVLYTLPDTNNLRVMVISDTHLGNSLQRLDVLDALYDYCAKEDIHIILNCGDFLEGINKTSIGKTIDHNLEDQLASALKDFPYDKQIINFLVLGNHDNSYLEKLGIDLRKVIANERHDILPIAYQKANIKIKNDNVVLIHPNNNERCFLDKITFRGHSHQSKQINISNEDSLYVYVPTCSDIFHNGNFEIPSVLDVTFDFAKSGLIKDVSINTLVYTNKFIKVNETIRVFSSNKVFNNNINKINYEEEPKILIKK